MKKLIIALLVACMLLIPLSISADIQAKRMIQRKLVTIEFTAPVDEFHAFGLIETPPSGVNRYVSSYPAAIVKVTGECIEAVWLDTLDEGDLVQFKYYANSRGKEGYQGQVIYHIAGGEQQVVDIETVKDRPSFVIRYSGWDYWRNLWKDWLRQR